MTKEEERQKLYDLSPASLPTNPSQAGYSAEQIKKKHYLGLYYLHDLIDNVRSTTYRKDESDEHMLKVVGKNFVVGVFDSEEGDTLNNTNVSLASSNNEEAEEFEYNTINPNEELEFNN